MSFVEEHKTLIKLLGIRRCLKNIACTTKINNLQVVVAVKKDASLLLGVFRIRRLVHLQPSLGNLEVIELQYLRTDVYDDLDFRGPTPPKSDPLEKCHDEIPFL
ncbi:hypothetical protein MCOR10_010772 [Pyricularia oryzae]|nr:hypothetical protein MCOR10_010772 [Pyricularia oryzae]